MKPNHTVLGWHALVVCLIGFYGLGIPVSMHAQNLSAGLIAYYPFSANTADLSGNGRVLLLSGAALSTDRFGQSNRALRFSDRLSTASTNVSLAGTSFSIGAWFFQDRRDPLAAGGFAQGDVGQAGLAFRLMLDYYDTSARFSFWFNDLDSHFVREFGKWIHVMGTFDAATRRRKLYLNGVIVAQDTAAYGFSGTGPLRFGFFEGLMDEVRVYNRALSDSEVQQVYVAEAPPVGPAITIAPTAQTAIEGQRISLTVTATGSTPLSYQWLRNGVPISGATSASFAVASAGMSDAGLYAVTVSNSAGQTTTAAVALIVKSANPGRLSNLSIRTSAGVGGSTLIVGFTLGGIGTSGTTSLLTRASGPALAPFGVPGTLPDPFLTVYDGARLIGSNDDWGGTDAISSAATSVGAFAFGAASKDAAIVSALPGSGYTAQAFDAGGATGVALVEVYDVSASYSYTKPRLINLSARANAGVGGGTMIAGFSVKGETAITVLIRGVGPGLAQFGVSGVLANPRLTLYRDATLVAVNDNWGDLGATAIASTATAVGAFALPAGSLDAAILATLQPGSYTGQVTGPGDAVGIALVEVYEVP